jgi:hypothetical protein
MDRMYILASNQIDHLKKVMTTKESTIPWMRYNFTSVTKITFISTVRKTNTVLNCTRDRGIQFTLKISTI